MNRDEAEGLAARIEAEPGWHAELGQDYFSGAWHVEAWHDSSVDAETGEHDGYRFRFPVEWLRVRNGLAEEARQAERGDEPAPSLVSVGGGGAVMSVPYEPQPVPGARFQTGDRVRIVPHISGWMDQRATVYLVLPKPDRAKTAPQWYEYVITFDGGGGNQFHEKELERLSPEEDATPAVRKRVTEQLLDDVDAIKEALVELSERMQRLERRDARRVWEQEDDNV